LRTLLNAATNKEKPFPLNKKTDLFVSSAIWQGCLGGLHDDKSFYRLVLRCGGGFSSCKLGDTIGLRAPCYAITLGCMQMITGLLTLPFLAVVIDGTE